MKPGQFSGYLLSLLIFLQYSYHLSFNYVPIGIRNVAAVGIALLILSTCIYCVSVRPKSWHVLILISFFSTLLAWSISYTFLYGAFVDRNVILDVQVFLLVITLTTFNDALPQRLLAIFSSIVLLYGGFLVLFGEPFFYSWNDVRPQSLTGGLVNVHPTAYFLTANVVIVDLLRRCGTINHKIAVPVLLIGCIAIVFYGVRSTWLILLVYYVGMFYIRKRVFVPMNTLIPFFLAVFVVGAGVIFGLLDVEGLVGTSAEHWGSGRVGVYLERFDLLAHRSMGEFLFGTGPGSDLLATRMWSGLRLSHSDFLHVFIERGLIGFAGLLLLIYAVLLGVTAPQARVVFLAIIAGSIVNNGILVGFGVGFYFYVALALAVKLSPEITHGEGEREVAPKPEPGHELVPGNTAREA